MTNIHITNVDIVDRSASTTAKGAYRPIYIIHLHYIEPIGPYSSTPLRFCSKSGLTQGVSLRSKFSFVKHDLRPRVRFH